MIRVGTVLLLSAMLVGCNENPTTPSPYGQDINPIIAHMRVGETMVFSVAPVGNSYNFSMEPAGADKFVSLEQISYHAAKITAKEPTNGRAIFLVAKFSANPYIVTRSTIYIQ